MGSRLGTASEDNKAALDDGSNSRPWYRAAWERSDGGGPIGPSRPMDTAPTVLDETRPKGVRMPEARLTRRVRFTARHHYGWPTRSQDENRRLFGAQIVSHSHDWLLEVEIVGPVSEETGFSVDLGSLDAALEKLLQGWDGGDLNECIDDVRGGAMQPSTESIAGWIHERLCGQVPAPARLDRVRLWESEHLGSAFPA